MEVKMKKDNKDLIEDQNLLNSDVLKSKITFQIEDKNYTLQMFILQEIKKLKLILEITDKNKSKLIYSNSFSLYDLISLNTFFSKFKDDYEAFNYLMNNYTKVDKTNEVSNNKEIKLSLLFTITEDYEQNNIKQQKIEFILHNTNMNVKYKSNLYLTNTIQNLKMTLEKFNSSISELKLNIDKEKIRKKNIKLELENLINNKFEEIKENKSINEIKLKIKNIEDKKNEENKEQNIIYQRLNEIYSKMDDYNREINELKRNIEEKDRSYNRDLNSSYKMKENDAYNNSKINEYLNKINSLKETIRVNREKSDNFENNINNKLLELNNKIILSSKKEEPTNVVKEIISLNNEDNKKIEKIIQDKINEQLTYKMKMYEEKILILNKKIIDLEIKNQQSNKFKDSMLKNDDSSFLKDNSYIDFKIHELEEKFNKNINVRSVPGRNEERSKANYIDDNKFNRIIESKMDDLKKEIYSMLNKSERGKDDYRNYNYKISTEDKIKKNDNKYESRIKPYDINKNINVNNSYIMTTSKINNTFNNLYEEDNSKNNPNISLTTYNSSTLPHKKKVEISLESNIITKDNIKEDFFLFTPIQELYQYNRYIKLSLCYRLTRDGDLSKNFHSKCDAIGPNLTIIKTKKGYIFGGFTNKSWKHLFKDIRKTEPEFGTEYKDEKAFGFSFNLQKIYKNGKNESVIFCNNKYGVVFMEFFKIYDECRKNGGICAKMKESRFIGQENDYEINGGEETFDIEEIEVFQIVLR